MDVTVSVLQQTCSVLGLPEPWDISVPNLRPGEVASLSLGVYFPENTDF